MNGETILIGLIGWPLTYSQSPRMHNAAYANRKINYAYVPLRVDPTDTDNLRKALLGLRALGFRGANVTIPYKQSIISYLDRLSPASLRANSVNTVVIHNDGSLSGDTTDGAGFMMDLKAHHVGDLSKAVVSIIGAGGASHAIAFAVLEAGCSLVKIHNRGAQNAQMLAAKINSVFPNQALYTSFEEISSSHIVINCTPPNTVSNLVFAQNQIIYDTNYMSTAVNMKASAEKARAKFISGLGMLLYSGALSFEIFTGVKPPIEIMKQALY